jgi:DNA-directed RNA polymerase subunit delta
MWGLTEWNPPEVKRTHTTSTTTTKTTGTKTKTTSRRREKLLEGIQEEE